MEYRHFNTINPLEKWLGKGPEKLQQLRRIHGFSNPEKSEEWLMTVVRSKLKQKITDRFLDHSQSAKKVYWLNTFLDDYQRYQENLKKPNDLPMGQLQAMRSDIQTSLKKVEESLTSDQQLPEAAKQNTKAFLDNHLAGMNAQIDKLKKLKTDKYFPYSEATLAYMDHVQEKLAKFAEKLGQTGNTTLDQLKENLTDLSSEIEKIEIKVKNEIDEIKVLIESTYKLFEEASNDRKIAFNDKVKGAFEHLNNIRLYTNQEREVTTRGLMEKRQVLRTANALLDELIETRIREEVDKWSHQVMDVKCIQPGPRMYRNFEIASVLDTPAFEQVAKDFDKALKQGAPEDIYRVLLSLQREPEAINSLDNAYRGGTNGKTLETALNERFGEPEDQARLEYALQLINQGKVEAEQAIKQEHFKAAVQRIHQALYPNSGNPKIEVAYAALTPFTRNTELLCSLDANYNSNFKTGLKSDIEHTLQGDPKAKDYALFLIGDQVLEKKVRSWSEAVRLQKALLKQTFRRDDGIHIPVPYDYLLQDSANWTHIICQALKEGGYESKKIIALSLRVDENEEKLPNLHVYTDLAPDMPDGKDPIVTSMYRMAPLIQVEASFGMVELVLDPGLSSKPLTIKQWMGKMSQDSFEHISLDAYKTKQIDEYQKNPADSYPADQTYVFTGSRNIPTLPFSPYSIDNLLREKPIFDQDTSEYYQKVGKAAMSNGAAWVPYIRMARSIREALREQTIQDDKDADAFLNDELVTKFLKDVSTFHAIGNTDFSSAFPYLYKNLRANLAKIPISAPIVERFEKLLSGKHTLSGANGDQSALTAGSVYEVGTGLRMLEDQAANKGAAKDTEGRMEVLQQEVDRWPLGEIHIERIQRPIFFRDCKIADVLDFKQLANDFYTALKPGKLPEDIYRVLQSLQREPEAINKLDNAYRRGTNGKTLETALNEHFGKPEDSARLVYAFQLINRGNSGSVEVIEPLSVYPSEDELDQVATRIHLALTEPNARPEVVYAALTPFERNTELLCKLNASYQQLPGVDKTLQLQIQDKLKGTPKDYALFLIGDQVMEKKEISHYEAMRLWKVVERLTFDRGDGVRVPVPYDSPSEWCQCRAHIMAQALKEMGYASAKIFIQSQRRDEHGQKHADLHVSTDLAPDMSHGRTVAWLYHVAPYIQIKTEASGKELLVLDPSLSSEPLTMKNWMSKMGKDSYTSITFEEFKSKMEKERQDNPQAPDYFPAGQTYIFTTSRNYCALLGPEENIEYTSKNTYIPDQYGSEYYIQRKGFIFNSAKQVPYNRMARSIRKELRNPTIQDAKDADAFLNKLATNFLADVSEYRSSTSNAFSNAFPNLYKDLIEHVKTRIGHLSDSSSSALFHEHLSGGFPIDKRDREDIPTRTNTQETDWAGPTRVNTQEINRTGPTRTNTGVMPKIEEKDLSNIAKQYVSEPGSM